MNKIIRDGFTVDERNLRRVNRKMDVFLNSLEMGNLKEVIHPQVQANNNPFTEWSMNLTQDQTTIILPNVYINLFIEWSTDFNQYQTIEMPTNFNNNNLFMEWNTGFTQTNTKQTNTSLLNIYNAGIIQHCKEQINSLQQYKLKRINGHSLVSRLIWVDGPITHWSSKKQEYCRKRNYNVILKILNNSEKMNSNYLNELLHTISSGLTQMALFIHSGNILIKQDGFPATADFGISKPTNETSNKNKIYGRKRDEQLILDILNGFRPEIPTKISQDLN
ncbi:24234_t:CDS:2 [Gigaspora rosea]|nr:24234_t:CDS:2 [Gigaspora rosea]